VLSRRFRNLPFRVSWRLRRWAATRSAAPWIAGGLERPDRRQRYSRSVDVRGWVSAPADRPAAVDVWLGDTTLQRLVLTPAPGAPAPAGHVRSPFDAVIPLEHALAGGWLRIVASAADPASASRVLRITHPVRARPGDKLRQRAAYGAVWDAQLSVAGTSTGVFMHLDEWERYRYLAEAFRVLRAQTGTAGYAGGRGLKP
jgi:hypothetical protein